jgi:virginiamycin A acetyltransferase
MTLKDALKAAADAVAAVLASPFVLAMRLGSPILGADRTFPGLSQALSLVPGQAGAFIRRAFYRRVLPRCGPGGFIAFGTIVSHPTAEIGRDVYVGAYCCLGAVTLEDDVLLGSNVSVINGGRQHGTERLDVPIREQPGEYPRVVIGTDSWVGDRALVMADVGAHCVIGAGSVVTRAIPDFAVAVGVPARVIRYRGAANAPRGVVEAAEAALP